MKMRIVFLAATALYAMPALAQQLQLAERWRPFGLVNDLFDNRDAHPDPAPAGVASAGRETEAVK
jgi:hypothetical protein